MAITGRRRRRRLKNWIIPEHGDGGEREGDLRIARQAHQEIDRLVGDADGDDPPGGIRRHNGSNGGKSGRDDSRRDKDPMLTVSQARASGL